MNESRKGVRDMLNVRRSVTTRPMTRSRALREIQRDASLRGEPARVITEDFTNHIAFNVMPNLPVEETLFLKEYRIWHRYIEAIFDREYHSSMRKSPDHLMFLTALVHLQKMFYAYICYEFDLDYEPVKPEVVKIWPTVLNINMPKLITKNRDIVHRLQVTDVFQRNEKSYYISAVSSIENAISIIGEAVVYVLQKRAPAMITPAHEPDKRHV